MLIEVRDLTYRDWIVTILLNYNNHNDFTTNWTTKIERDIDSAAESLLQQHQNLGLSLRLSGIGRIVPQSVGRCMGL